MGSKRVGIRGLPFVLLALSWLLVWSHPALATYVSGDILQDTTWTVSGSPYTVLGTVSVADGATLTIDPGVEVRLNWGWVYAGHAILPSSGRIVATGVTFRGEGVLCLKSGSGQSIRGCDFTDNARCILRPTASGTFSDNDIVGWYNEAPLTLMGGWKVSGGSIAVTSIATPHTAGVFCTGGGQDTVENIVITSDGPWPSYGVRVTDSDVVITGCTISGFGYPYYFRGGDQTLSGNTIDGNGSLMVATGGSYTADGSYHAWGLPVKFLNAVTIMNGASLTIDPGSEVQLNGFNLDAGTESDSGTVRANGATFTGIGTVKLVAGSGQSVENCDFVNGARLELRSTPGTIANNDIAYSGSSIPLVIVGPWSVAGGTVSLTASSGTMSGVKCTGGGASLSNLIITGSGAGAEYGVFASASVSVTGCTISGFKYPYYIKGGGTQTLSGNTVDGNDSLVVATGEHMHQSGVYDSEWELPVRILVDVTVDSGAVLTVDPGVEVRLGNGRMLKIGSSTSNSGILLADGATFAGVGLVDLHTGSGQSVQDCAFLNGARLELSTTASGTIANNTITYEGTSLPLSVNGTWTVSGGSVSLSAPSGTVEAIGCIGGTITLSDLVITGLGVGAAYGVKAVNSSSTTSIIGCTISGFDYPFCFNGGDQMISGNTIDGNDSLMVATGAVDFNYSGTFHLEWGLPVQVVGGGLKIRNGATLTVDDSVEVRLNGESLSTNTGVLHANAATFKGPGRVSLSSGSGQLVQNCDFVNSSQVYLGSAASGVFAANDFISMGPGTPLEVGGAWTVSGGTVSVPASSGTVAGITCSGGPATLSNVAITGSGGGAAYGVKAASDAWISGCTISGFDYPYFFRGGNLSLEENTIDGNDSLLVATGGDLIASGAFHSEWGMPVRLVDSSLTVRSGATLTVDPDVEVRLNGRELTAGFSASSTGAILASGAMFRGPGRVVLNHGSGQSIGDCGFPNGAQVYLGAGASGSFADNDFISSGPGTPLEIGGTWAVSGGTVSVSASTGTVAGITCSDGSATLTYVMITGSGDGAAYGVKATSDATVNACTISGFDYPYHFCGGDQTLAWNTIAGNDSLVVATGGDFTQSGSFQSEWGLPVRVVGEAVTVRDGSILTIEPGVQVRLNGEDLVGGDTTSSTGIILANEATFSGPGLVVLWYGSGQSLERCVFESGARLSLNSEASGAIADNEIAYSGTSVPLEGSGSWTITGGWVEGPAPSAVAWSSGTLNLIGVTLRDAVIGLKLTGSAAATAYQCNFLQTPTYGVENQSTVQADARWCYWGDPSGPSGVGPGTGAPVSSNVLFDPWEEEPTGPAFVIPSVTSSGDSYQNGADTARFTVVTKSNAGSSNALTLCPSLRSNLGDHYELAGDEFSLVPGEEHISEFDWAVPDSGYPWEFHLRLILVDGGDTVLVYDKPSLFGGMLLTQAELAQALDTLQAADCLPPEEPCAVAAAGALPYSGSSSDALGYVDDLCVVGGKIRAGRYLRAGVDLLGAVVSAIDPTLDAIDDSLGAPVSTIPSKVALAKSCGEHLVLDWLPEGGWVTGAMIMDTLLAHVAEGFEEVERAYSNEVFVIGEASLRVGVDEHWTGMDSLGITKTVLFGTAGGTLKWAHVGPGPMPFGVAGENPHSAIRAELRGLDADYLEVGVLHGEEDGSILPLRYTTIEFLPGSVAYLDLADTAQTFLLQIDLDGDGTIDITAPPGCCSISGVADLPPSPLGRPQLLANRPNPFNPATEVRYVLPAEERVRLAIYDVAGRLVTVLVHDRAGIGEHRAVWDGRSLTGVQVASGVYFAALEADGKVLTRKITLVR